MDKDAQVVIDGMNGDNHRRRCGLLRFLRTKIGEHKDFKWYFLPIFTLVSLGVGIHLRPTFDYWKEGLGEWVDQYRTGQVTSELEGKKLFSYRDDFEDFSNHPHAFYKPIPQELRNLIDFLGSEKSEILPDVRRIIDPALLRSIKPQFWADVVHEGADASRMDFHVVNKSDLKYGEFDSSYEIRVIDYGPDGRLDSVEIVQFSKGGRIVNLSPRSSFSEFLFTEVLDPAYQVVMDDLPSVPSDTLTVTIDRKDFDW